LRRRSPALSASRSGVNCEGATDTLILRNWTSIPFGSISFDQTYERYGCYSYETPHSVNNGYIQTYMGTMHYEYEVHRPSGITYGEDSVYLDKGETGTLEIQY